MKRLFGRRGSRASVLLIVVLCLCGPALSAASELATPTQTESAEPEEGESDTATPATADTEALPPVQPPVIQVDEVSVTAARAERAVLDQPGNISVITREDILESGVNTVPELLRREPGIFVTNTNGSNPTGINVEVRGFNNGGGNGSRTLVLIDGRRANLPQTGSADWGLVKIDDVERIEIVRGPASAVYGDNAIGGVIEIFTRRATKKVQVEVTGRGGSYGMGQGSLFAGGNLGDFSGSLFIDGYTADGYRDRSGFTTGTAKGNLRYTLGETLVVDIEGGYSKDERDLPGALTDAEIAQYGRRAAQPALLDSTNRWRIQTGFAQGALEWSIVDDVTFKLQPTWREWNQKASSSQLNASSESRFDLKSKTSTTTVNAQFEIDRSLGIFESSLVVGGEWLYELDDRTNSFAFENLPPAAFSFSQDGDTSNRRDIASAYIQEELELLPGVLVSGGFRYDYARYRERDNLAGLAARKSFDRFSPKAALTWRIMEPVSVYFSYAQGVRFPNFDEIYPLGLGSPETNLKPEHSNSYELGAKFRNAQIQAGLALYHMDVDDEILCIIPPGPGSFGFFFCGNQNIDRVRHRGLEASVDYRPEAWVQLYANFTYENAEIKRYANDTSVEGKRIPITPEYRGSVGVNFFPPVPWLDVAEIGVNANIVGPRYVASDLLNEFAQLPTYGTVDLHGRAGKRFLEFFEVTFFFQIQNLNGESYSQFAGLNSQKVTGYYPSPKRNFDVGLTVSFER